MATTSEKCFCHLNGYEVKDARARADIALIKETQDNHAQRITEMESKTADYVFLESRVSDQIALFEQKINLCNSTIATQQEQNASKFQNINNQIAQLSWDHDLFVTKTSYKADKQAQTTLNNGYTAGLEDHEERIQSLEQGGTSSGGGTKLYKHTLKFSGTMEDGSATESEFKFITTLSVPCTNPMDLDTYFDPYEGYPIFWFKCNWCNPYFQAYFLISSVEIIIVDYSGNENPVPLDTIISDTVEEL